MLRRQATGALFQVTPEPTAGRYGMCAVWQNSQLRACVWPCSGAIAIVATNKLAKIAISARHARQRSGLETDRLNLDLLYYPPDSPPAPPANLRS